jgi:hypothetical protein
MRRGGEGDIDKGLCKDFTRVCERTQLVYQRVPSSKSMHWLLKRVFQMAYMKETSEDMISHLVLQVETFLFSSVEVPSLKIIGES